MPMSRKCTPALANSSCRRAESSQNEFPQSASTSPGCRCGSSCSRLSSTGAPCGTHSSTTRGVGRAAGTFSSVGTACIPACCAAARAGSAGSQATTWWPRCTASSPRLSPIRPSPTIANLIRRSSAPGRSSACSAATRALRAGEGHGHPGDRPSGGRCPPRRSSAPPTGPHRPAGRRSMSHPWMVRPGPVTVTCRSPRQPTAIWFRACRPSRARRRRPAGSSASGPERSPHRGRDAERLRERPRPTGSAATTSGSQTSTGSAASGPPACADPQLSRARCPAEQPSSRAVPVGLGGIAGSCGCQEVTVPSADPAADSERPGCR